jgi:hypothetical protein
VLGLGFCIPDIFFRIPFELRLTKRATRIINFPFVMNFDLSLIRIGSAFTNWAVNHFLLPFF